MTAQPRTGTGSRAAKRLIAYVKREPGSTYQDIAEALGLSYWRVQDVSSVLLAVGVIRVSWQADKRNRKQVACLRWVGRAGEAAE